jgi:hypothetical protein
MSKSNTNKSRFTIAALIVGAVIIAAYMLYPKPKGDEEAIRLVISDMAVAVEEGDVRGFMSHVSERYADDYGNDRNAIKAFIFMKVLRGGDINIFIRGLKLEIDGTRALGDLNVIMTSNAEVKSIADILPEDSAGYSFSIVFEKEGKDWMVLNAEWKNIGARAFL